MGSPSLLCHLYSCLCLLPVSPACSSLFFVRVYPCRFLTLLSFCSFTRFVYSSISLLHCVLKFGLYNRWIEVLQLTPSLLSFLSFLSFRPFIASQPPNYLPNQLLNRSRQSKPSLSTIKILDPSEGPVVGLNHYNGDVASILTYATQVPCSAALTRLLHAALLCCTL